MNKITKTAVGTSIATLILLGIVIISGTAYPDYLFTYGVGFSLILMFISIFLFVVGWGHDFYIAYKQKNKYGILILVVASVLFILTILLKYCLR